MSYLFDETAVKKPTNVSLNADLLAKARAENINISATLEQALLEKLKQKARDNWLNQNRSAINAMNDFTDKHGLFSDEHRVL
ncbi:type II toxin-antitoxin system CcdA family antitoxin [Thiomicrospira cyclica]|uniref:Post-segregation antitoxin CcdA n=1 Tax=Thiomicrospira cyclica (strain DSM 14477 / JCM 11371 / ALM1) TaxID=717773 RepID=F6DCL1_THICA|nr:type II toxin-antitoxin system CcdA family antitoxin [Thiomicrospira cyclica]AEG31597.1 Post-segregation antitoxin CcdA [Thiomicrospira cyclica ALM1]